MYIKGSERMYLGLTEDDVVPCEGRPLAGDASQDLVPETCAWTICSCGVCCVPSWMPVLLQILL